MAEEPQSRSMQIFREAGDTEQEIARSAIKLIRRKKQEPGLNITAELTKAIKEIIP
jgi:hypothetical protein